jgi:pyruvate ferredoxin oxidoreductase gamma subunit
MYRIRFHGRGGQGMKTASRILGSALFHAGFEVQDAPRYGAERRGAPMFAYVRAAHHPIQERGIINHPDLVVVADASLFSLPVAGVLVGVQPETVLMVCTDREADQLARQYRIDGPVLALPRKETELSSGTQILSAVCAGAAARLLGNVSLEALKRAVQDELLDLEPAELAENLQRAEKGYALLAEHGGSVVPREEAALQALPAPQWIDLQWDTAALAAPSIHGTRTSLAMQTGAWRILRPVVDEDTCTQCGLCRIYCPEGAIDMNTKGFPTVDLLHCKGCLICMVQCPAHAIQARPEPEANEQGEEP